MASVMASQPFGQNLVTFCKFTGNEAGIDCSAPVEMNHEAARESQPRREIHRDYAGKEKQGERQETCDKRSFTGLFCPFESQGRG